MPFFGFSERLCSRIPAAVGLFVRGLLAAGWREHGVPCTPFFYFFILFLFFLSSS
jgi:hypothetical protein